MGGLRPWTLGPPMLAILVVKYFTGQVETGIRHLKFQKLGESQVAILLDPVKIAQQKVLISLYLDILHKSLTLYHWHRQKVAWLR